jgi:hypothetical protein
VGINCTAHNVEKYPHVLPSQKKSRIGTGSGTLKKPRFCRIPGTGSEGNPKLVKRG